MKIQKVKLLGHEVYLKFTEHALARMNNSNLSLEELTNLLRIKKCEVVGRSQGEMYIVQVDCIQIIIDAVSLIVKTIVVTTVDRLYRQCPKFSQIFEKAK